MSRIRSFWGRWRRPDRAERDLSDELRATFELLTEENVRAGMSTEAARRAARVSLGNLESIKDAVRDARTGAWLETLARDVRYGARFLARTPMFSATAILTIAIGLGLNAAVFTVFNGFVLRAEAVRDPHALYRFTWSSRESRSHAFTLREYERLRNETTVFSDAVARRIDVVSRIEGRHGWGHLVSDNFFQALGVSPHLGRTLQSSDSAFGAPSVVVLGFQAWQRFYASDPTIVGRTIRINGVACEVVGVATAGFHGLDIFPADYWAPLTLAAPLDRRSAQADPTNPDGLDIIGRLASGLSERTARSGLELWAQQMTIELAPEHRAQSIVLRPKATAEPFSASILLQASPLFLLFGLVLVIACANVANLMLARGVARQREIGIRLALGATRARLVRQLLTESLLLSLIAATGGLLLSRLIIDVSLHRLLATMPAEIGDIIRIAALPTDWRIAAWLMVAAVATTILFGLLPALQATRLDLVRAARGSIVRQVEHSRVRSLLVVVQIMASVLLLIGAAVLLSGMLRIDAVDPGLRMTDTIRVDVEERSRQSVLAALSSEPLVVSLAASWPGAPMMGASREVSAALAGRADTQATTYRLVSAEYFAVVGLDVVAGRAFSPQEAEARAPVALVSRAAARQFFPSGQAVGQTLRLARDESRPRQQEPNLPSATAVIVGVVRDVPGYSQNDSDNPGIYLPISLRDADSTVLAQVRGDTEIARRRLTEVIARIEPHVEPLLTFRTFDALQTYPMRVAFWISGVLGVLALTLAISGLYAVLSFLVAQRAREIGIRLALGASIGVLLRQELSRSFRGIAAALVAGVVLAGTAWSLLAAAPFAPEFVRRIDVLYWPAYAGSALIVILACLAAASVPALRAARIDPIATLRQE